MKDDKVVPLNTGYKPKDTNMDETEVQAIRWSLALLHEEIEALAKAQTGLTRAVKGMNDRLNVILNHVKPSE